jgi:hypothetical protein
MHTYDNDTYDAIAVHQQEQWQYKMIGWHYLNLNGNGAMIR